MAGPAAAPRHGQRDAPLALAAYLLLTLGLTYPLLTQFGRAIPGDGFDGWQNAWNLWWTNVALLEKHTHPWFTDLLYYPTGVGLLFHTLNAFNGFTFLPIQLAFGLLPAYNAVVLFSFAGGGLGAWLLARYVIGPKSSRLAAFAAGAIFTFSPFHFAHLLGHMQVISLAWMPFFVLYLLRIADAGMRGRAGSRARGRGAAVRGAAAGTIVRQALLAAFFLALIALCDWYYVLYCLIFTAIVATWVIVAAIREARAERSAAPTPPSTPVLCRLRATFAAFAGTWLLWAALLSPLLVPMVREARQSSFMVPDPNQSRILSADLLAFVTPQAFHPLWGQWAQERGKVFTSTVSEHTVFAGFTALGLAGLGIWSARRRRREGDEPRPPTVNLAAGLRPASRDLAPSARPGLWLLAALVFLVLALGPVLHVGGRTALLPGGGEIPLPYAWLVRVVPFMNISRSVSRFDAMAMLALGVLAARGLDWLVRRRRGRSRPGRIAAGAAIVLILFEFLPAPYPMSPPDTPGWYATLAADPRPGAVLNLPMNWDRPGYLLYQTEHRKPLTAAYISRDDPRTLVERAPVLQHFRHLGPDILAFDLARQGEQVLADLGVRWVILDRYKMPGGPERDYTEAAAQEVFAGRLPTYRDDRLTVYQVGEPGPESAYLLLGSGWGPFDAGSGTRAFASSASVIVQAPAAGQVTLRVRLAPGSAALDLPEQAGEDVARVSVQPGANQVWLHASQPGGWVTVERLAVDD